MAFLTERKAELWLQVRTELEGHLPADEVERVLSTIHLWSEVVGEIRSVMQPGARAELLRQAQRNYNQAHDTDGTTHDRLT